MQEVLERPSSDREAALLRLKKRRDFQGHLVAYLVVNAAVWGVWAVTGAGDLWPAWLTGIWAVGLVMNAWEAYFRAPITETDVQREIERLHPQP
jgi:hypothetical protein